MAKVKLLFKYSKNQFLRAKRTTAGGLAVRGLRLFCDFLMKIVILPQCVQRQTWLRVMSVGQLIFPLSPFDAFSLPQGVPTVAFVYVNADSDMTVKQDLHFNLSFPTPC